MVLFYDYLEHVKIIKNIFMTKYGYNFRTFRKIKQENVLYVFIMV